MEALKGLSLPFLDLSFLSGWMEGLFPLALFPPGLDHSILIAVWVGAMCLFFFTEAFGWGFVGLVVPGYLASVFISRPVSGWAIVAEVLLTLCVVRAHLDFFPRSGWIYTPFGRERFFLIVLWGTAVRIVCESWLFGALIGLIPPVIAQQIGLDLWQPDFFGIGLVLVPLTANMLWRNHLESGGVQMALATSLTYLVMVFVLLPYTNLSLSEFQLLYEDAALNLADQPKVYVILLVGSMLAARANQLYGWDFNGILVPSLLGIAWLWPVKVAATLVEVVCVVMVARALVQLPHLNRLNIEGPRRIMIVLTLDLLYKAVLVTWLPDVHEMMATSDMFGFGYLLPSLLATKIWVKRDIPMVMIPTVVVSVQAFVVGSIAAYLLQLVPLPQPPGQQLEAPPVAQELHHEQAPTGTLAEVIQRASRAIAIQLDPNMETGLEQTHAASLERFAQALSRARISTETPTLERVKTSASAVAAPITEETDTDSVESLAQSLGYAGLDRWEASNTVGWQVYTETTEVQGVLRGLGTLLWKPSAVNSGQEVKEKSQDNAPDIWILPQGTGPGAALPQGAVRVIDALDARTVYVAGGRLNMQGVLLPTAHTQALSAALQRQHDVVAAQESVQERIGKSGTSRLVMTVATEGLVEGIYLPRGIEPGFPLQVLQRLVGEVPLHWRPVPESLRPWIEGAVYQSAGLVLSPERWAALAADGHAIRISSNGLKSPGERLTVVTPTSTAQWLAQLTRPLLIPAPLPSQTPSDLRLMAWRHDVLEPLMTELHRPEWQARLGRVPEARLNALLPVADALDSLGYRLEVALPEQESPLVAVLELEPARSRSGALILRPGGARAWALEVLEPEAAGLTELASQWLLNLDCRALVISGAAPSAAMRAQLEGLLEPSHASIIQLIHEQLVVNGIRAGDPVTVVRMEAGAAGQHIPGDLAMASVLVLPNEALQPAWLQAVQTALEGLGLSVAIQRGEAWSASLRLPPSPRTRYSLTVGDRRLIQMRISRMLRQSALGETANGLEMAASFLKLEVQHRPVMSLLGAAGAAQAGRVMAESTVSTARLEQIVASLADLQRQGGPSRLIRLVELSQMPGRRLVLVRDTTGGGAFLVSQSLKAAHDLWSLNLTAPPRETAEALAEGIQQSPDALEAFARGYRSLLVIGNRSVARLESRDEWKRAER